MVFWQTASASPSVKMKREQAAGENQRERRRLGHSGDRVNL